MSRHPCAIVRNATVSGVPLLFGVLFRNIKLKKSNILFKVVDGFASMVECSLDYFLQNTELNQVAHMAEIKFMLQVCMDSIYQIRLFIHLCAQKYIESLNDSEITVLT